MSLVPPLLLFLTRPRLYCLRAMEVLGIRHLFKDELIFCVDDVMPHAKPDAEAFAKVLTAVGSVAEKCVMFEDSMKNIRAAKE
jgi:HAD superfamily hydrolase (TIGR01509 family)